jgi:glycosyltransferase involved in cell wall biosynthesis
MPSESCDVSIVIPTFNRCDMLRDLLADLVTQVVSNTRYEIIVADNGSTDATLDVIEHFTNEGHPIVHVREGRKGPSHARNAGIARARGPIIAFLDDDEKVPANWLMTICRTFFDYPDVDMIGGRVLPQWQSPPPAWLSPELRGPISFLDRGDEPCRITRRRWMVLGSGNMAIRRDVLVQLGGFSPDYPRSQDRELLVRLLLSGRTAMYVPDMFVYHCIDGQRLTKMHFRKWNRTEGRMRAGYAFEELFVNGEMRQLPANGRRWFGVAPFVLRALLNEVKAFATDTVRGRRNDAFRHELRVLYLWEYIHRRHELASRRFPRTSTGASADPQPR